MPKLAALLASSALILPTAGVLVPAEAAGKPPNAVVTNCTETKQGVTLRVKMRDNGTFNRVRVSHPRGHGRFREPRVKRTHQDAGEIGTAATKDRRRGSSFVPMTPLNEDGRQNSPSFRVPYTGPGAAVNVVFELVGGKRFALACVEGATSRPA